MTTIMPAAAIRTAADRDVASALLLGELRPGDVILLKGSRGAALDLLLEPLQTAAANGGRA